MTWILSCDTELAFSCLPAVPARHREPQGQLQPALICTILSSPRSEAEERSLIVPQSRAGGAGRWELPPGDQRAAARCHHPRAAVLVFPLSYPQGDLVSQDLLG